MQVFNLGVPSYNTEDERLYLEESYDLYQPHLVFVQYMYGNDAHFKRRPRPETGLRRLPGVQALREIPPSSWAIGWLSRQEQRLRFLIQSRDGPTDEKELLQATTDRMLQTVYAPNAPGWVEVQEAMGGIVSFCRDRGIALVVGTFVDDMHLDPESRAILAPAFERIQKAMYARGVEHAIRLDEAYTEYVGREEVLWVRPDDVHWSPLAHELVAVFVADYVAEDGALPE